MNHQKIKNLIDNNFFGKLIRTDVFYYGGWVNNGSHIVDILNFLFTDKLKFNKLINYNKNKSDIQLDCILNFEQNK